MKIFTVLAVTAAAFGRCVSADFNQCLGVEIAQLATTESCGDLYEACETGVRNLNSQLQLPMNSEFRPVSIVSATESRAKSSNGSVMAMLVELAPIERCAHTSPALRGGDEKCTFDMTKVEIYSILLRQDNPAAHWSLDGYKHHALSDEDRAQIVTEYRKGNFYGSNLAIGIFDTPNLPAEAATNSADKSFSRFPVGIFAVIASATVSVGLLVHHRRRLHNGYAPIVITKRGQLRGRTLQRAGARPREHSSGSEERSLKQETAERYAV